MTTGASTLSPFAMLAEYEQLSRGHAGSEMAQPDAPDLWRGICYQVGTRRFVSGIDEIDELLIPHPLTVVPGSKPWLLGLASVRGELVPVIDLAAFLFGEPTRASDRSRLLLVAEEGARVGLLVDQIIGRRSLDPAHKTAGVPESDDRVARFVNTVVTLDDTAVGLFSMRQLTHAPDFLRAAA